MASKKRPGLWANIHAKRKRIASGSGEKMRKPGSEGAPTKDALRRSQTKEAASRDMPDFLDQNRPAKVKEIYEALKRDHPQYSAEKKARIASSKGAQIKKAALLKEAVMKKLAEFQLKEKHKNPSGGLNSKGRAAYNKATGGNLKAPQPEGGSRRNSFCARMGGMKKKLTSKKTASDPNSRINKALRKWKC